MNNIWERRKQAVINTLRRGSRTKAAILSANATLLATSVICGNVITMLREEGLVATVQIDKVTYEYRLIEKFEMPAPKMVPLFIPQIPYYDLVQTVR